MDCVSVNNLNHRKVEYKCINDCNGFRTHSHFHAFFYKQRFLSTQPRCCLTFSWIELQMLLRCCSIHIIIIILRHVLCLLYLCPCLDLGFFMLYLCDLFFFFIFILNMINRTTSWIQTHLFFCLFLGYVQSFLDNNVDE